jgi:hypothetical protein
LQHTLRDGTPYPRRRFNGLLRRNLADEQKLGINY